MNNETTPAPSPIQAAFEQWMKSIHIDVSKIPESERWGDRIYVHDHVHTSYLAFYKGVAFAMATLPLKSPIKLIAIHPEAEKSLGQIAFEAYMLEAHGGGCVWCEDGDAVTRGWHKAAQAVASQAIEKTAEKLAIMQSQLDNNDATFYQMQAALRQQLAQANDRAKKAEAALTTEATILESNYKLSIQQLEEQLAQANERVAELEGILSTKEHESK